MNKVFEHIFAFLILIIYCIVQVYCISNPGDQDDIVSARMQDVLLVVVTYYFYRKK